MSLITQGMRMEIKIPVYRPWLAGNERKYVLECLDSSWISSKGSFIPKFEHSFAEYMGVRHAASVCNGTVALHTALVALEVGQGDEVIVPTLSYIASVNAIAYAGATPVFVDADPHTWQMDPEDVRRNITTKTKAIMAVHLYGQTCDLERLTSIAKKQRVYLIEDCAESLGSEYQNKKAGSFGDVATFSFFGNKTLTTGEGGMVVTNDKALYDRVVHFRGQGLVKHREYWHDAIGYNYRMTNICAAIGLAQLERVHEIMTKKRWVAERYKQLLHGLPVQYHDQQEGTLHSYCMFSILVPSARQREPLRDYLRKAGIETRPLFYPVHTMPMYVQKFQKYPVAEDLSRRGISLPSYPELNDQDLIFITRSIEEWLKANA